MANVPSGWDISLPCLDKDTLVFRVLSTARKQYAPSFRPLFWNQRLNSCFSFYYFLF